MLIKQLLCQYLCCFAK